MSQPFSMTKASELILLDFIACWNCISTDPEKIKKDYQGVLQKFANFNPALKDLEIVWGPAINTPLLTTNALVFIVRNPGSGEYTLIIRGTNPISLWSWLVDDFLAFKQLPWSWTGDLEKKEAATYLKKGMAPADILHSFSDNFSSNESLRDNRAISLSAMISLGVHINLKDNGVSIKDFLIREAKNIRQLNISGHSLAGMMAPTYALWLYEQAPELQNIPTDIYGFAGPTAGNDFFAQYSDTLFSLSKTSWNHYRLYNNYDIVPNVWTKGNMDSFPYIYSAGGINPGKWERNIINLFLLDAYGNNYSQPGMTIPLKSVIPEFLSKNMDDYLVQIAYQHVFPYLLGCGYSFLDTLNILLRLVFHNLLNQPEESLSLIEKVLSPKGVKAPEDAIVHWENKLIEWNQSLKKFDSEANQIYTISDFVFQQLNKKDSEEVQELTVDILKILGGLVENSLKRS